LRTQQIPPDFLRRREPDLLEEGAKLRAAGRYIEALAIYEGLLDRRGDAADAEASRAVLDLRLHRANCLWHVGCYGLAKDECEEMLGSPDLAPGRRLLVLENFVICCVNLGRFTVAMMALEQAERDLESPEAPERLGADLSAIRGLVHVVLGEPERAVEWYRKAIRLYDGIRDPLESCRCTVNLGYALLQSGDRRSAEEVLGASLAAASSAGYGRLEALALGTLALLQFRKGDLAAAEALALRSNSIARPAEHISLVFRNCFYLWRIAQARGDEGGVRANERTLRVYVSRVEDYVPEVQEFRAHLAGAKP
jgi:tetratricopeptide (TPR) repeat protein